MASAVLTAVTVLVAGVGLPGAAAAAPAPARPALLAAGEVTTLTVVAEPVVVAAGQPSTLSGRLVDQATGVGEAGAVVALESRGPDGVWATVAELTTDAEGWVTVTHAPTSPSVLRFHHGAPGSPRESVSEQVMLTLRPLTAALSQDAVRVGRTVTVAGVLAAGGGRWLRLERRVPGGWAQVDRAGTAPDGSYSFAVTPTTPGFWRWRVVRPGTASQPGAVARLPRLDAFRLHRYAVTTRGTVRAEMSVFREVVAQTLNDPHGWARAHRRFREVPRGGDFTVVLSQARHLPGFSSVCSSTYSCRVGRYVVINQDRWRSGSPYFPGSLADYRRMVINHETGHWLGRGHAYCPGPGRLAPVMQQQSKGLHGCRVNPWPLRREVRAVS